MALVTPLLAALAFAAATFVPSNVAPTVPTENQPEVGVYVSSGLYSVPSIQAFESQVGSQVNIAMEYVGWSYAASESSASAFPGAHVEDVWNAGYLPEIVWEPWNGSLGVSQPAFSLSQIVAGRYDSYIRSWAAAARSFGHPLLLRFAEEMNGDWNSWSAGVNGNTASEYVAAWRHVHEIFTSVGATNVTWVWSPNVVGVNSETSLTSLYPGASYVNEVGVDGYSYPLDGCPAAAALFGPTVQQIEKLAPGKPLLIAETGVSTTCSNRLALITDLFDWAKSAHVAGVTWFNDSNYTLTGDASADRAFGAAAKLLTGT